MRSSIAAQLVFPFIAICSLTILLLAVASFCAMSAVLSGSLDEKSRCLVRATVNELRGPLLLGEDEHVKRILSTARQSDSDLVYAVVSDTGGTQLASMAVGTTVVPEPNQDARRLIDQSDELIAVKLPDDRAFEIMAPIVLAGERGGILRMGFSRDRINGQIRTAELSVLVVGVLGLALGSFIYIAIISRAIIKPVGRMVTMSKRIANGDVGETVEVKRTDEIGELVSAMNHMVQYLREMSDTADAIARGDLNVVVSPRAATDSFGNAIKKMVEELNTATKELILKQEEANKLAAIVKCSHDAIVSVDVSGRVMSWNAGAEALLGYTAEEVIGKSIEMLFPDSVTAEKFKQLMSDACGRDASGNLEIQNVRRDGSPVEVSITLSEVVSDGGSDTSFSVIARDITHKSLVEKRLKEFYSVISHELRTPLTSIRGSLGLISDGAVEMDSPDATRLIQLAKESSVRLVHLINDILDMRKIEEGGIELHLEPVACAGILQRSIEEMQGLAREKDVRLLWEGDVRTVIVADADRLVQVLANLISNAIKYSEAEKEIKVRFEETATDGVKFSVSDTGPGIPAELQYKLFGQFQQIDSSDRRAKGGTGLGLAISKALVELHGGKIGVSSERDQGSTFWFTLPPAKVPANTL